MKGWMGKVLRVDLSRGKIWEEPLDAGAARDFIGGRGLGIHYLLDELDPKADPLGPENMMVLATGPLTGTKAPTGARYMITTKSPLTGALTCSNSGGKFPFEFKKTGFDAVIIRGRAQEPVYLWIDWGRAELRPAGHLWGLDTHATDEAVRGETEDKAKVAAIGPAGEKGVLFAAVMNDKHRAAGRSGVGAVMGSKNLKAVAVRGEARIELADPEVFKAANKRILGKFNEAAKDNPPPLRLHGTAVTAVGTQNFGVLPTRNWQTGQFDGWEKIYGVTLTEKYLVKNSACFSCPIGCGRVTKVEVEGFEGEGEGPEYETIYAMGSNCGIDNLAAITKANYICNELGMDTITMGATVACAMELFQGGYLTAEEVGMDLPWGDGAALVELTRRTGLREGFGDILAQGSLRMAARYGHPELAMVAKGQEFPGYEPRGSQAMGLAYATSPIGGSHMRGDPAYFELLGVPTTIDPQEWQGKAKYTAKWQDLFAIIDAAGLCVFFSIRNLVEPEIMVPPIGILELLNAATGADYSLEELERAGERIVNAERLWLERVGFSRAQDTLPSRILNEPLPEGPAQGQVCHLEEMLEDYYGLRGWDEDGLVSPKKLAELGLDKR